MNSELNVILPKLQNNNEKPEWLNSTDYEVIMGSTAYGVSTDFSDLDIYAMTISPLEYIFPERFGGYIHGFSKNINDFKVFQKHHYPHTSSTFGDVEVDMNVYNITHYFRLTMDNNPNMLDSLFVPDNMILNISPIGQLMRDNRDMFLSKKLYYTYFGYAHKQMSKAKNKNPIEGSKRKAITDKFGWDVKFGYHTVRLALQAEYALNNGTMILDNNVDILKDIREGKWTLQDLQEWIIDKENSVKQLYETSDLRHSPDENEIKKLLKECIKLKYESLDI